MLISAFVRPNESLVVQVPNGDVSIAAAGEADFGVRADGQGVARRGRGGQLRLDARRLGGQIPDGQRAGFASNDQCAAIRQQLTGADVVIPVLLHRGQSKSIRVQVSGARKRFRNNSVGKGEENPPVITNKPKDLPRCIPPGYICTYILW